MCDFCERLGAAFVTLLERPGEQQKSCSSSLPRRQRAREELQTECRKRRRTEEENEGIEERQSEEENQGELAEMAEMDNESFCDEDAGQEAWKQLWFPPIPGRSGTCPERW